MNRFLSTCSRATNFALRLALSLVVLGTTAALAKPGSVPDFALLDLQGRNYQLHRTDGKAVVLFFTGVGCPIARKSAEKLHDIADKYGPQGISVWTINSFANDSIKAEFDEARELGIIQFPYLRDTHQLVAMALHVERTAEVVVIGLKDHRILYQGAIDDQFSAGAERPEPGVRYLSDALEDFLANRPVRLAKTEARGCRIALTSIAEATEVPSYTKDVAPILRENCVECHRAGAIGPWAMDGHAKVENYSRMVEEVLLTRRMPPFDPNPEVGHFADSHRLSREQTQTLLRWIAAGAPRGDGPDPLTETLPALPDWPMGKPDVVVRLPEPQKIPATGVLDYLHIPVPTPTTNEFWISGADIHPGNRRVLHHAILYATWPGCPDSGTGNGVFVYGWAPGSNPSKYPAGVGKRIGAGAKFNLELHYTTIGSAQTDDTEIALYLHSGPQARNAETREAVEYSLVIPPGSAEARHVATYAFKTPATLYGLSPHMHFRGKWMKYELLLPDGKRQALLDVPRYDFKWQLSYRLKEPLKVPAGSWLMVTGAFDNSEGNPANPDPKKSVTFGPQSWDEMFIGFFDAADEPTTQASVTVPGGPVIGGTP